MDNNDIINNLIEEFLSNSYQLISAQSIDKAALKKSELYLQSFRKIYNNESYIYPLQACLNICTRQISPGEELLASQTIYFICQQNLIPESQLNALFNCIIQQGTPINTYNPIITQLCLAISCTFLHKKIEKGIYFKSLFGQCFEIGLPLEYFVNILSCIPEIFQSKSFNDKYKHFLSSQLLNENDFISHTLDSIYVDNFNSLESFRLPTICIKCLFEWILFSKGIDPASIHLTRSIFCNNKLLLYCKEAIMSISDHCKWSDIHLEFIQNWIEKYLSVCKLLELDITSLFCELLQNSINITTLIYNSQYHDYNNMLEAYFIDYMMVVVDNTTDWIQSFITVEGINLVINVMTKLAEFLSIQVNNVKYLKFKLYSQSVVERTSPIWTSLSLLVVNGNVHLSSDVLESVVTSIVIASGYINYDNEEKNEYMSEQDKEDFDTYRLYNIFYLVLFISFRKFERDILRELCDLQPLISQWILKQAMQSLLYYKDNVAIKVDKQSYSKLNNWSLPEALLHSVSALVNIYNNSHINDNNLMIDFLFLINSDFCFQSRPICRIVVAILYQLIPLCHHYNYTINADDINHSNKCTKLFKMSINTILFSIIYHPELIGNEKNQSINPIGWFIPFRLKQDHIGCVALFKLIESCVYDKALFPMIISNNNNNQFEICINTIISISQEKQTDYSRICEIIIPIIESMNFEYDRKFEFLSNLMLFVLYYLSFRHADWDKFISAKSYNLIFRSLIISLCCSEDFISVQMISLTMIMHALHLLKIRNTLINVSVGNLTISISSSLQNSIDYYINNISLNSTISCAQSLYVVSEIISVIKSYQKFVNNNIYQVITTTINLLRSSVILFFRETQSNLYILTVEELEGISHLLDVISNSFDIFMLKKLNYVNNNNDSNGDIILVGQTIYELFLSIHAFNLSLLQFSSLAIKSAGSIICSVLSWKVLVEQEESCSNLSLLFDQLYLLILQSISQAGILLLNDHEALQRNNNNNNNNNPNKLGDMDIYRVSIKEAKQNNLSVIGEKELNYLINFWLSGLSPVANCLSIDWSITSSIIQFVLNMIRSVYYSISNKNNNHTDYSIVTWKNVLSLISVTFGHVIVKSKENIECCDAPMGKLSVINNFTESGLERQLLKYLLFGMDIIFPSSIRDDVIKVIQRMIIFFGANIICTSIETILHSNEYIIIESGSLLSKETKSKFANQIYTSSISNDWKKFKSTLKTILKSSVKLL